MTGMSTGNDSTRVAPLTFHTAISTWSLRPEILAALILTAVFYLYGVRRAQTLHPNARWSWGRSVTFLFGLVSVGLALMSFIGAYDTTLFWVHMIQHLMLIMVAPALLASGGLEQLLLMSLRPTMSDKVRRLYRTRVFQAATSVPVVVLLYAVTVVATHLTGLMTTIMANAGATNLEHLAYLFVGYLYFVPVFGDWPERTGLALPTRILIIVLTMPIDAFTGVVLTMDNRNMFPARSWGPSPVTDLHWGGAVMWLGGSLIMTSFVFATGIKWSQSPSMQANAREGLLARARYGQLLGAEYDPDTEIDIDEDERARDAYNARLAYLAERHRKTTH